MHKHEYAELHIAPEGSALNVIDGAAHGVIPGDVFVCLPETIYFLHKPDCKAMRI